jgi:hypothetical protein
LKAAEVDCVDAEDEANLTEIEILPDGRICVFGMSAEVLAVVNGLPTMDADRLAQRRLAMDGRETIDGASDEMGASARIRTPLNHRDQDEQP